MPAIAHPYLLVTGLVLALVGIWLWRFSSRHGIDIKGAAISSGTSAAWRRELPQVPDDIRQKYERIAAEKSHVGKAKVAGTTLVKAGLAKVAFLASLVMFAAAAIATAAAFFWT
ncbi:MAG TPA: hypothetical protein PK970_13905 [Hyphomicrobiaceae bacterium]|nr:hypothetical protein [Hyphomicrobiaceae bacterium]